MLSFEDQYHSADLIQVPVKFVEFEITYSNRAGWNKFRAIGKKKDKTSKKLFSSPTLYSIILKFFPFLDLDRIG